MHDKVLGVREFQELLVGQAFLASWEDVNSRQSSVSLLLRSHHLSVDVLRRRLDYRNTFGETVHVSIVGVELDLIRNHGAILARVRQCLNSEIVLEASLSLHIVHIFCAVEKHDGVGVFLDHIILEDSSIGLNGLIKEVLGDRGVTLSFCKVSRANICLSSLLESDLIHPSTKVSLIKRRFPRVRVLDLLDRSHAKRR